MIGYQIGGWFFMAAIWSGAFGGRLVFGLLAGIGVAVIILSFLWKLIFNA